MRAGAEGNRKVVGRGVNNSRSNPVMHGEIVAIGDYANKAGEVDVPWPPLRLYTTAEPCCMCQAAILWSGIREVYFGTSISRLSELGWRQIPIGAAEIAERTTFINCRVTGGVLALECDELFAPPAVLPGWADCWLKSQEFRNSGIGRWRSAGMAGRPAPFQRQRL